VELLTNRTYAPSPLKATVARATGRAGSTVPVHVTVQNTAAQPASGDLTVSSADGWTVTPATAHFGPIAAGASEDVTVEVAVPADAAAGSHALRAVATSDVGTARAPGSVLVVGDTIEFTAGSDAEQPWLSDADGSQLTNVNGRDGRYADNTAHFTYRFDIPEDVTGGTLTLDIGNQYLVDVSTDGQNWTTVLRDTAGTTDLSNLQERSLDLNTLRAGQRTLFVRVGDAKPENGWGGWLAALRLQMTTG
jgi:hypothetical protein